MKINKNIVYVLIFILLISIVFVLTRSEFMIRFNTNENEAILDISQMKFTPKDENRILSAEEHKVLLVVQHDNPEIAKVFENVSATLDYMQINFDVIEASELNNLTPEYDGVIIMVNAFNLIRNMDQIMEYVYDGGSLFVAHRPVIEASSTMPFVKFGILEHAYYSEQDNIILFEDVMIKGKQLEIINSDTVINETINVQLSKDSRVLAENTLQQPLLWEKDYGRGKILFFNGTMFQERTNRGFVSGCIYKMLGTVLYPAMQGKVVFIDDFPAPVPFGGHKRIQEEYNRNVRNFYREVWWPDLLELAAKYEITYTGVIIGSYNDKVSGNTQSDIDMDIEDFIFYGRELLRHGGEMGYHGFNHQSLSLKEHANFELGYNIWPNSNEMKVALNALEAYTYRVFPDYKFQVYVPPSNILSDEGYQILFNEDTDLKVLASLYDVGDETDSYEQEFHMSDDGVIHLPRFTSNYLNNHTTVWAAMNGVTLHGLFSHFIHPDDVIDDDRSRLMGWRELRSRFEEFNRFIYRDYGWLTPMTATQGANEVVRYSVVNVIPKYYDDRIEVDIENIIDSVDFFLRSDNDIGRIINGSYESIDVNTYVITTSENHITIYYEE